MKNELIKISPAEFGLDDTKASQIKAVFMPMLDAMEKLEEEANSVKKMPLEQETCAAAKELRLKYVKIRTTTAKIHKEAKSYYLASGRFVDAWKNAQLAASEGKEAELEKIEKHFELIEKARIEKLIDERWKIIKPYVDNLAMNKEAYNLSAMSDEVFNSFSIGMKSAFEAKKLAEQSARDEEEKEQQEERERQHKLKVENEKLRKEQERLVLEKLEQDKRIALIEKAKREEADKATRERQEQERKIAELELQKKVAEETNESLSDRLKATVIVAQISATNAATLPTDFLLKGKVEFKLCKINDGAGNFTNFIRILVNGKSIVRIKGFDEIAINDKTIEDY